MVRKLFLGYLVILLAPLALVIVVWAVRDVLSHSAASDGQRPIPRRNGSEEAALEPGVAEVRASED